MLEHMLEVGCRDITLIDAADVRSLWRWDSSNPSTGLDLLPSSPGTVNKFRPANDCYNLKAA